MVVCFVCFVCLFVCLFCLFCCNFVRFWLTLQAKKDSYKEKIILCTYGLGTAQPLIRYPDSSDLLDLQRYNAIDLTSRWKVRCRQTFFYQNEVQRVLYKLVLVTYPLDQFQRI